MFGIKALLTEGSGGIFTVDINGKNAFDKDKAGGRFPTKEEIFAELEAYAKPLPEDKQEQPRDEIKKSAPSCDWSPPDKK